MIVMIFERIGSLTIAIWVLSSVYFSRCGYPGGDRYSRQLIERILIRLETISYTI